MSISEELKLSTRAENALHQAGISTVDELTNTAARKLLRTKNCGAKTVAEIQTALHRRGLSLLGADRISNISSYGMIDDIVARIKKGDPIFTTAALRLKDYAAWQRARAAALINRASEIESLIAQIKIKEMPDCAWCGLPVETEDRVYCRRDRPTSKGWVSLCQQKAGREKRSRQ